MMNSFIRLPLAAIALFVLAAFMPADLPRRVPVTISAISEKTSASFADLYHNWQLQKEEISFDLFTCAMKGYHQLMEKGKLLNSKVISIIDFSQPSWKKRLFIIDTETGSILYKTLVAHGRNSGKEFANRFSNAASSLASSPGFYITTDTYIGKHGYSLKLQGCEKGINDNAMKRAIVVHGAEYVSESFIEQNGFLGRSHGCPAVPQELSNDIINTIKNGSCLFIYAPQKKYLSRSALLKG